MDNSALPPKSFANLENECNRKCPMLISPFILHIIMVIWQIQKVSRSASGLHITKAELYPLQSQSHINYLTFHLSERV